MGESSYLKVVQGFGLYHFIVSLPLALPIISHWIVELLGQIHLAISLPGKWLEYDPTTMLFLNLFAVLACMWGWYRLRHPSILVGRYEGWAMIAFMSIVIWYVINGASALWLSIAIVDGIGAIYHIRGSSNINS